jgi:hypothetical protein
MPIGGSPLSDRNLSIDYLSDSRLLNAIDKL